MECFAVDQHLSGPEHVPLLPAETGSQHPDEDWHPGDGDIQPFPSAFSAPLIRGLQVSTQCVGHVDSSQGLPWWLNDNESACNAGASGDEGSIPGLGKSPGGGKGYPLQYSGLENSMDRGVWWATVHGLTKSHG